MNPFLEWALSACFSIAFGLALGGAMIAACCALDRVAAFFAKPEVEKAKD